MRLTEEVIQLLRAFEPALAPPFELALKGNTAEVSQNHPLYFEVTALTQGDTCSLPYFGASRVNWVTFGGSLQALYRMIDDVRAWLIPNIAWEEAHPVVAPENACTPLGQTIVALSPHGYFRWSSAIGEAVAVAQKLRQMRELEQRRPVVSVVRIPSLFELRRQFQVAIATADWPAAEQIVDTIDAHQLDAATNTAQMRVRLWGLTGDDGKILRAVERTGLLHLRLPSKVLACILEAYARIGLAEMEERAEYQAAAEHYKAYLHPVLAAALIVLDTPDSPELMRLMAYRAWADGDRVALSDPALLSTDPVIAFLVGDLSKVSTSINITIPTRQDVTSQATVAPPPEPVSWQALVEGVLHGSEEFVLGCIDTLIGLPHLLQPEQAGQCSETLIEIFTDPAVTTTPRARTLANEVLLSTIDNALCEPNFPRPELVELYSAILEIWVQEHGESAYSPDGQLVIALAEGLLTLSRNREREVVDALRRWWHRRPNRVRIPWLLEALDLLSIHLSDLSTIEALWVEGADFIRRDASQLSRGEALLWRQVGHRLGLPEDSLVEFLGISSPGATPQADSLRAAHAKKFAIVTLQERAGRIAAETLKERTGAEIQLVTSVAADDATRAAAEADVILFVWAASKHAVLRAFDAVREKIQYVQGTGPASIVLAAERWAANRAQSAPRLTRVVR